MSNYVSVADKAIRIIGFSVYLSLLVFVVSLLLKDLKFSAILFFVSFFYFAIIFILLTTTKNIHFNILIKRDILKKKLILYQGKFCLAKTKTFRILFLIAIIFLCVTAIFYFYKENFLLSLISIILIISASFYFFFNKISIYIIKEGVVFDYGKFIVLLRWEEIKAYSIKDNRVVLFLKGKNIRRTFYVKDKHKIEKILKYHITKS
ncbi:MAG: hypothetical protein QXG86_02445 [Candidatus Woesearchaeota archaeon]